MNREELEAELAVLDQTEALEALKKKIREGDTSEETRAAFKTAKEELYAARQVLRQGRVAPAPEDGVAEPGIAEVTSTVKEVG